MFIKDLFKKRIDRPIQIVIQAEQNSEEIRYNELEEFVLTTEGEKQLKDFLQHYTSVLRNPTIDTGVWIAGFFGSGKSHFMKIVSYLLNNQLSSKEGSPTRDAVSFLIEKTNDSELQNLIEQTAQTKNETIMFNISAQKSLTSKKKLGIAETVYNKFNEQIGFSKYAKIAYGEHQLDSVGKLEKFKEKFKKITGNNWEDSRQGVLLYQDQATEALKECGVTGVDAKTLFYSDLPMTVEDVAEFIADYALKQDDDYRLVFLIDEISQYLGNNSQLILELQTIVELLGSKGRGKVWLVVTSQKSLSDVTKDGKGDEYSKIQARFKTRINLTSSDTDEVIKKRLLEKTPVAERELRKIYQKQKDLLATTLSFKNDTTKLPNGYRNEDEFVEMYPLIPYEINMLQSIYRKIRDQGEGGASTSEGERTIISTVQMAILQDKDERLGDLVTMAEFYPSIKQQLDPSIVNTIEQALNLVERGDLQENDIPVLHVLYFIRGLEETMIRPVVDNLAVMLIPHIEASGSQTLKKVQFSLDNLTRRLFASKKVDGTYEFLTSEERKANEAINRVRLEDSEVPSYLQRKLFTEILTIDKRTVNIAGKTMRFEGYLNNQKEAGKQEILKLKVWTTPPSELVSMEPTVSIHLKEDQVARLEDVLMNKLKIDKYVRHASSNRAGDYNRLIVEKKRSEAGDLDLEASKMLVTLMKDSVIYVNDDPQPNNGSFDLRLDNAYKTLIIKTYDKMNYVTHPLSFKDYKEEWIRLVTSETDLVSDQKNLAAISVMESQLINDIQLTAFKSLDSLIEHFVKIPYGWEERDIIAILLTMVGRGQFKLKYNGKVLNANTPDFVNIIDTKAERERILIEKVKSVSHADLQSFFTQIKNVFPEATLDEQQDTVDTIVEQLDQLVDTYVLSPKKDIEEKMKLLQQKPGYSELEKINELLANYINQTSPEGKFEWFKQYGVDTFDEISLVLEDLQGFYFSEQQYSSYVELERFFNTYKEDIEDIIVGNNKMTEAAKQFKRIILSKELPGRHIKTLERLRSEFQAYWNMIKEEERTKALTIIKQVQQQLKELNSVNDDEFAELIREALEEADNFYHRVNSETSSRSFYPTAEQARQLLERTKMNINSIVKERNKEKEKSIVFLKSTSAMDVLFQDNYQIETEDEINQAVERLRLELLKQLKEGIIIRQQE
ncbi:BREX system P-loop protein BrxC [Oceanobacillus kimchii]|uniref:BREX system P-loop protein BrxC n=1 Tax=Oceanobacillus kimchii TaxID=746691 RepID=UPI0021A5D227|nr:BREX system P-loop protein BrxC [Oceanobacillus kimchii]MCT1577054.1 BREX system P-loop protein BrxC [Oceanobacillus kimchii]MCT2135124.1 BREX system P-loop protein BrxC [Oceanobacillus kimchii]